MKTADKGTRLGNFIIDFVLIVFIYCAFAVAAWFVNPALLNEDAPFTIVLIYSVSFFYYFLLEATTGKTIGKLVTKTIVTDKMGMRPTLLQIFIRTLSRFIPFEGLSFVFGFNGLHDLLSKTIVTRNR